MRLPIGKRGVICPGGRILPITQILASRSPLRKAPSVEWRVDGVLSDGSAIDLKRDHRQDCSSPEARITRFRFAERCAPRGLAEMATRRGTRRCRRAP